MPATLGHRDNPYSETTYNEFRETPQNWPGGWVKRSDDTLFYSTVNFLIYNGQGSMGNPYPESVYTDMTIKNIWTGGWVQSQALVYITSTGRTYVEQSPELGSRENPFDFILFQDMCNNGLWQGGWVYTSSGDMYIPNYDSDANSSGSGCCGCSGSSGSSGNSSSGSQSGQSSGSNGQQGSPEAYVNSGSMIGGTSQGGDVKIIVKWKDGYTDGSINLSEISLDLECKKSGFRKGSINAGGVWSAPLTISVHGVIYYSLSGIDHEIHMYGSTISVAPGIRP